MKDDGIFTFNVPIEWSRKDIISLVTNAELKIRKITHDESWWFLICSKA